MKKHFTSNLSRTGHAVNYASLLSYTERILNLNDALRTALNHADPGQLRSSLDAAGYSDYESALSEYKSMLMSFASSKHDQQLKELSASVEIGYSPKGSRSLLEFVPFFGRAFAAENYIDHFNAVQSVLNRIAAYLQIKANENQTALS